MNQLVELLRKALVDVLEGCGGLEWIRRQTGLPLERCNEIYDLYLLAQLGAEALPKFDE